MSDDKMRAEFEAWAKAVGYSIRPLEGVSIEYWSERIRFAFQAWQAAYAAGRMAVQREAEEWSKRVNKRWIEMENKQEGER